MLKIICIGVFFLLLPITLSGQKLPKNISYGFNYGIGQELKNTDYLYTNQYYKLQVYYVLGTMKNLSYELLIQPEVNFAKHQLLNFYFVLPTEPNFQEKRDAYTQLKTIHEYVLNLGGLIRKNISKSTSMYALVSVGPMITDTQTERLSKGFAFSDVFALGFTWKINQLQIDIRPNFRHTSNAGLQNNNAGFNTYNFEFGVKFSPKVL